MCVFMFVFFCADTEIYRSVWCMAVNKIKITDKKREVFGNIFKLKNIVAIFKEKGECNAYYCSIFIVFYDSVLK